MTTETLPMLDEGVIRERLSTLPQYINTPLGLDEVAAHECRYHYATRYVEFEQAVRVLSSAPVAVRQDTVAGIEQFRKARLIAGDTDPQSLNNCDRCGHEAMYVEPGHRNHVGYDVHVECSNTSCGLRIPSHYRTREDAAKAWNRKAEVKT